MKIAISGCGITGTAVAWFLSQDGHDVTILEQSPVCGLVGAGILLQPSGQKIIEEMNLLEPLLRRSRRLGGMMAMLDSGRTLTRLQYSKLDPELFGMGVHRGRLFELLLNACQSIGVNIVNSARVVGYSTDGISGALRIKTADPGVAETAGEFDFLIAADGSRSRLREFSGIKTKVVEYEYAALWTTGKSDFQPDHLYQLVKGTHHLVGLLPIGEGECSYFWGLLSNSFKALQQTGFDKWKSDAIQLCPQSESILGPRRNFDQFTMAGYRHVVMKTFFADRIIFLGDAAHATSPHLGQGVNLGLEDAACFSRSLAETGDFLTACQRFSEQRRRKLRYFQQLTRILTPFFQSRGYIKGVGRDWFLPWLPYVPFVRTQMLRTLCGTKQGWLG